MAITMFIYLIQYLLLDNLVRFIYVRYYSVSQYLKLRVNHMVCGFGLLQQFLQT
jgi:hypothetical protein